MKRLVVGSKWNIRTNEIRNEVCKMNRTKQEYAKWIDSLADWDWYGIFTFRYLTSRETASRLWKIQWLHSLQRAVNGQVHFIRVLDEDDKIHYHCLLRGVKDQKPSVWARAWHNIGGIAKIEPYVYGGGAAYYLGEKCSQGCEVDFSKNLEKARLLV